MNKFIFTFGVSLLSLIGNQAAKTTKFPNENDDNTAASHNIAITQVAQSQTEEWVPCAPFKPSLLAKMQTKAEQKPHKFKLVGNTLWINNSAH